MESAAASAVHSPLGAHSGNDNTNRARMNNLFIGSLDAILSDGGDQKLFPSYPDSFRIISQVRFIADTRSYRPLAVATFSLNNEW